MKTTKILMAFAIVAALSSCEKDTTGDVARVTNYPTFEVSGENPIFLELGTAYVEPGVKATENGAEIPVTTSVIGHYRGGTSVDENVSDWYAISYAATNADGFVGTAEREVYVVETGDLVNSISGLYTSTVVRNGSSSAQYTDMPWVLIWENSDGTYELSCGIGGYYQLGRAYGLGYKSGGAVITANDISTNDFSYVTFANDGFGGTTDITDMMVDAANKKITFTAEWSFGYTFEVELTQVQL